MSGDPISFNTLLNYWYRSCTYQVNVYDRLITYDAGWNLAPQLAAWWEVYDDSMTHIFHLRTDVTWHDGEPFTSADVKWHFENVANGWPAPVLSTPKFANLVSIETPDDYTVIFKYSESTLLNIYAYTQSGVLVLPKHIYEGDTADEFKANPANWAPIGTGPFKVTEYEKEQYIIMEANEDYFGGRPYLDKLQWMVMPERETVVLAIQNGEIDFWLGMQGVDYEIFSKNENLNIEFIPATRIVGFQFNNRPGAIEMFPWLADKNVRIAMAHAIDMDAILDEVYYKLAFPNHNIPSIAFPEMYNDDVHENYPKYDPALAEKLLDAAGYPKGSDGTRFSFTYLGGGDIGELMKYFWGEVGIDIKLFEVEYATSVSKYMKGGWPDDFPVGAIGTGVGPDADLRLNFHGDREIGNMNSIYYDNEKVSELVMEIMRTTDKTARTKMILEFQDIIFEDFQHVIMLSDSRRWVWNNEFAGYEDHPKPVYVIDPVGRGGWWTKGTSLEKAAVTETKTVTETQATTVTQGATTVTETETATVAPAATGMSTTTAGLVAVVTAIIGAAAGYYLSKQK